jgi:putative FmdB family regulatory protein
VQALTSHRWQRYYAAKQEVLDMPLYEYYCPPCGGQFEVLRPISQMDDAAVCPSGHTTNNRVLSMFAFPRTGRGDVALMDSSPMACGADDCCSVQGPAAGMGCSCC